MSTIEILILAIIVIVVILSASTRKKSDRGQSVPVKSDRETNRKSSVPWVVIGAAVILIFVVRHTNISSRQKTSPTLNNEKAEEILSAYRERQRAQQNNTGNASSQQTQSNANSNTVSEPPVYTRNSDGSVTVTDIFGGQQRYNSMEEVYYGVDVMSGLPSWSNCNPVLEQRKERADKMREISGQRDRAVEKYHSAVKSNNVEEAAYWYDQALQRQNTLHNVYDVPNYTGTVGVPGIDF